MLANLTIRFAERLFSRVVVFMQSDALTRFTFLLVAMTGLTLVGARVFEGWSFVALEAFVVLVLFSSARFLFSNPKNDQAIPSKDFLDFLVKEFNISIETILIDNQISWQLLADQMKPTTVEAQTSSNELQAEVLQNMRQGALIFDRNQEITSKHSPYIATIFDRMPSPQEDALEFLFQGTEVSHSELEQMKFQIQGLMGMSLLQWKISSSAFIKETYIARESGRLMLRYNYFPVQSENSITGVMVVVEDITALKAEEDKVDHKRRQMEKIFSLLQVSDTIFDLFRTETGNLFDNLKKDLKLLKKSGEDDYVGIAERMFRYVHTIKGNSRLFKLNSIQDVAHNVEDYLSNIAQGKVPFTEESVAELTDRLMEINEEIYSYTSLRREILGRFDRKNDKTIRHKLQWVKSLTRQLSSSLRTTGVDIRRVESLQWELNRAITSIEKTSILEYAERYNDMLVDLATHLGKKIEPLQHELEFRYFLPESIGKINDILIHCLRNSIDHGIEYPQERIAAGKSAKGLITLESRAEAGKIFISLTDDGKGIDPEAVALKAVEYGLINKEELDQLSDTEKLKFIFSSGFSTLSQTTTVSGRGVGMDAVLAIADELKGTIDIESKLGVGTTLSLTIEENQVDVVAPLAILDLEKIFHKILLEYKDVFEKNDMTFNYKGPGHDHCLILADESLVELILRGIFMDLIANLSDGSSVDCRVEVLEGRRRVDSFEFYRLKFNCRSKDQKTISFSSESRRLQQVTDAAEQLDSGSVIVNDGGELVVNIPSCIPVKFDAYIFDIVLCCDQVDELRNWVQEYFRINLRGWTHRFHIIDDENILTDGELASAIVFLDNNQIERYQDMYGPLGDSCHSLVLAISGSDAIDNFDSEQRFPENLVFTSFPINRPSVIHALESLILRRFNEGMLAQPAQKKVS